MKTYVAEIDGEAVMAFRAEDYDEAYDMANGDESEHGGMKTVLTESDRAGGGVIWDGQSEIAVREATDAEHERWQEARDAATGDAHEGFTIDPKMGDDLDEFNVFLIPISDPLDEDDGDDNDEHAGH
jgi:hypothetical protein